eukprot:s5777_g5.t1
MEAAEAVVVGVRVRPFNDRERGLNAVRCIDMEGPTTLIRNVDTGDEKTPPGSAAVCHSFPSLAEAKVYCYAAGRYTVCLEVALGFDPVLSRAGGFLLATPASLLPSLRANAAESSPNALVGPFHPVSVPGMEEDELGETPAGVDVEAVLIDMEEGALGLMELFDTDLTYEAFVQEAPHVMPLPEGLHTAAMAWIEGEASERMAF